jgi:GAF domain-containing protein
MTDNDAARHFAASALEMHAAETEKGTGESILHGALQMVPSADWASLTIKVRRGRFSTLASTDERAAALDQLQYSLREGPCVESADHGDWLRSGDLRTDERWPTWGRQAADQGAHSVLSIRLLVGDEALGALNLYGAEQGRFVDPAEVDTALTFGTHAAIALTSTRQLAGLRTALHSRHLIGVAQGILIERFDLSLQQAFDVLRRLSNERNEPLATVAEHVVEHRALPDDDPAGHP